MSDSYDPQRIRQVVRRFISADATSSMAARMILLALQEDAVDPLADEYYSGVNPAQGVAILELIGHIGGFEAMLILRNVFQWEDRPAFKRAAALALLANPNGLSPHEWDELRAYVDESA